MKLTHPQRQLFRMLANARRPSGRQGHPGPLLLTTNDRRVAFRLAEIGEDEAELIRWRAKEPRDLTAEECRAGLWLLESKAVQQWLRKWSYGDLEGRAKIDELASVLEDGAQAQIDLGESHIRRQSQSERPGPRRHRPS
jgi:hypothetical protein